MKRPARSLAAALLGAALPALLVLPLRSAQAAPWQVQELGSLGGSKTVAMGVNRLGQVVGHSHLAGDRATHAFITDADGLAMQDIGTLGGESSIALGVNNFGQVVGWSHLEAYDKQRAFLTNAGATALFDLGTLGGDSSRAWAVTDAGVVVGDSLAVAGDQGLQRAFQATFVGGVVRMKALSPPGSSPTGGTPSATALALTNGGLIVGNSDGTHAFAGTPAAGLPALPAPAGTELFAAGASPGGPITGYLRRIGTGGATFRGFLRQTNGTLVELGTLGGSESYGWAVNASGQVAGHATTADGREHAFVTQAQGTGMVDLNAEVTLPDGAYLSRATAINDYGQVAANDNRGRAYLLTPITAPVCSLVYRVTSVAASTFTAELTLSNLSGAAQNGWSAGWVHIPFARLLGVAGATGIARGGYIGASAPTTNPVVPAGGSVRFTVTASKGSRMPATQALAGFMGSARCQAAMAN